MNRSTRDAGAEPGTAIGGYTVSTRRADDDAFAVAAGGVRVLLTVGSSATIGTEAHALDALARSARPLRQTAPMPGSAEQPAIRVPRVIELAELGGGQSLLAIELAPTGALSLEQVAAQADALTITSLLAQILDLAAALEAAGLDWSPQVDDVYAHAGRIGLHRLRGATRLPRQGRVDPRALIDELGVPLASDPRALLPGALLRIVLPSRDRDGDCRTIEGMRAAILRAAEGARLPADDALGLATLGDLGLLRDRHEDAIAHARGDDWAVLVVCDGVSASYRSDIASALAVRAVREALSDPRAHPDARASMRAAIRDAHHAICDEREAFDGQAAGTTIVAALVLGRTMTIGWVGDSRAYWLGEGGDELLTRDHSWVNDVIESGALSLEEALASPHAHALTRCLGPLEGGDPDLHAEPDLVVVEAKGRGTLILCSDGLWNYYPSAESIAQVVASLGATPRPAAIARALVHAALSRGGQDNVSVAVLRVE